MILRKIRDLMFFPTGVEISLEAQSIDTTDFLERQGWKRITDGGRCIYKVMGLFGEKKLPKDWPYPYG